MNLLGLSATLTGLGIALAQAQHQALKEAVAIAHEGAVDRIGQYHGDVGPVSGWPPLAQSTQDDRVKLGFPADEPLLRTGELRDSIVSGVAGMEGWVGSAEEKALYAEIGTATQPPRSFLEGGFFDREAEIKAKIGATTHYVLFK